MIMAASLCLKLFIVSMLLVPLGPLLADSSMSCRAEESSALLQFKDSFLIDRHASSDPLASPKVLSWTPHGDCCSWVGVDCDGDGHVIGLDLTSSCLFGSINSNSSLFNLKHLQKLSLADNNFNYSAIPQELALLSSTLTHLDLSSSNFAGQIPSEISMLSRLVFLDLSFNVEGPSLTSLLQLKKPTFTSLVQNLTNLEDLVLSWVDVSSTVPNVLSHLSSLSTLYLESCNLVGEFPSTVFLLPNLQYISIRYNGELTGHLPHFSQSPLKSLKLGHTRFSGELPNSIQNLHSLTEFDVRGCNFTGPVPSSLGSLTNLTYLYFGSNFLQGPVQKDIFSKLVNLEFLELSTNNLSGTLEMGMFHGMRNLTSLYLGNNPLLTVDDYDGTLPNLHDLHLGSCNLRKFPHLLKHQQNLGWLSLSSNKISGQVPSWFCNTSKETLLYLSLSHNLLTGLDQCNGAASWVNLEVLNLSDNLLGGSLPTPPPSIIIYGVRTNTLTGEIPHLFCNLSSLFHLDLRHNNLGGKLPRCLSNMSALSLLTVNDNSFSGTIPDMCTNGASRLERIDLSENHLQGKIPRSLANCTKLRGIDVGGNQIDDTFPLWMGNLKGLELLMLGSNRFHGPILHTENNPEFPSLRIIDLSHNRFYGVLPCALFSKWQAMKKSNPNHLAYMQTNGSFANTTIYNAFSMILANKGSNLVYSRIPNELAAIDFSSNNFSGEIPRGMGNLDGLYMLNLANNHLSGSIPFSLANLTVLESLDLSNNKLSGEIPRQLAQLSSLAYLNLSHNNLVGKVPQGRQFDTFQDSSFDGNSGLCGELLITKRCSALAPTPSVPICSENCEDVESSSFPSKWDWMVIAIGYVGGLVVGVVIGNTVMEKKPEWLVKVFGKKMQPRTRRGKRSRRN